MEHRDLARWIDAYERAWRTPGTDSFAALFASSATYVAAPFDPSLHGRAAIATFWEGERESAEEAYALTWRRSPSKEWPFFPGRARVSQ